MLNSKFRDLFPSCKCKFKIIQDIHHKFLIGQRVFILTYVEKGKKKGQTGTAGKKKFIGNYRFIVKTLFYFSKFWKEPVPEKIPDVKKILLLEFYTMLLVHLAENVKKLYKLSKEYKMTRLAVEFWIVYTISFYMILNFKFKDLFSICKWFFN